MICYHTTDAAGTAPTSIIRSLRSACAVAKGGAGGRSFNPGEWGVEFAGVRAGQVEDVDVGVLGCDAAGDDVALGDDSFRAAGNVEEGGAGGVEQLSGFCDGGVDGGGVFGELVASHRVGGEKRCVAALFSLGRVGVELVEQDAVDFGGVFGVHPVGVGVG